MHSKNNRQNHDFQIAYFLAGSCHTADQAYALLCDLREDRAHALRMVESSELRAQARVMRARQRLAENKSEADNLEARAELSESEANSALEAVNRDAAIEELAFINRLIDLLQPLRKYAHLPDRQAHEAIQMEEWRLELIKRAENYLLAGNAIPADQLGTMRLHPQFELGILPEVQKIEQLVRTGQHEAVLKRGSNLLEVFKPAMQLTYDPADSHDPATGQYEDNHAYLRRLYGEKPFTTEVTEDAIN